MTEDGTPTYADLTRYAAIRSDELSGLLAPYVGMTDRYGEIVCRIVVALGSIPPVSPDDAAARDLIADGTSR